MSQQKFFFMRWAVLYLAVAHHGRTGGEELVLLPRNVEQLEGTWDISQLRSQAGARGVTHWLESPSPQVGIMSGLPFRRCMCSCVSPYGVDDCRWSNIDES